MDWFNRRALPVLLALIAVAIVVVAVIAFWPAHLVPMLPGPGTPGG